MPEDDVAFDYTDDNYLSRDPHGALAQAEANRIYWGLFSKFPDFVRGAVKPSQLENKARKNSSNVDPTEVVRLVDESPVDPYNVFEDADLKRKLLRKIGYANLWVGKGKKVALDDAMDVRVGKVLRSLYERSLEKVRV